MTAGTYTCQGCGGVFEHGWSYEEAQAEAKATFTAEELAHTAVVCEDCWQAMRRAMPDFDARYDHANEEHPA